MNGVDISKNYGNGTMPVRGRESHTADLGEFDRYVNMLREMDRETEEEMWKVGNMIPGMIHMDESEEGHWSTHEPLDASEDFPKTIDIDPETLKRGDSIESSAISDSFLPDRSDSLANLRFPFNNKFWDYFRSLLSNAKPVGFCELEDPNTTIAKGPEDANAFMSKLVAIKSINPIQPAVLAREGGFDEDEVLAELFYATSVGLMAMRFAPECVQCGSAVMDTDMLGRVPNRAACAGCNAPNVIDDLEKVKVLFLLNSDVLYILAENYACTPSAESLAQTRAFAAVPATATGSGFSYSVGTGEDQIAPMLDKGRYRMHCPVAKTDNYLIVERNSKENENHTNLRINVSDLTVKHSSNETEKVELRVPHGRIRFDIIPDTNSFFVLWIQEDKDNKTLMYLPQDEREVFTTAAKVMHHPLFNALFREQQIVGVPRDIFFSVSNVVLVFTDIVDSTRLYTNLGDGEAFRLVRKHFQVLFASFIKRGGRVVKTIGDAVMASFITGRAALEAVSEAMELLPTIGRRPDNDQCLEIRVGVHCGKATIVPLNGINDYFGQTTNIAARVQSVAKASECFVTKAVLDNSDTMDCYKEIVAPATNFRSTPATELSLKGLEHKVQARGFRWEKRHKSRRTTDATGSSFTSVATYANRTAHTRISFRDIESELDNSISISLFDRPAESGRRSSNLDATWEGRDE